tara:strand:+ start:75420 stop:78989 length:3570 start_codon:yes stop_codon:yes gene_type:complete
MSCNRPTGPYDSGTNAGFQTFTAEVNTATNPSTDVKVSWIWYPDGFETHNESTPPATPTACHISHVKVYRDGVEVSSGDGVAVNRNDDHQGVPDMYDVGEFFDTGLTPGTTYSYTITAYIYDSSPAQESLPTSAVTVTTASTSNQQSNNAPVASDSSETVVENGTLTATAVATDADGDALTYSIATNPANGTVSINTSTGAYTYVPTANYIGSDTFSFFVTDGVASDSGTVSITVSRAVPNPWYISVTDAVTSPWVEGKLVWAETVSNSVDLEGFKLYQRVSGASSWTLISDVSVGLGNTPTAQQTEHIATGLTASTSYEFYVVAYNSSGNSTNSNTAYYTTVATPTGMQTIDVDEQGETGVISVTGVFYDGWGWTETDPGSQTDVTQWPNVNMISNNSMSATSTFAAGAHTIYAAAKGWATPSLTHQISFNTYNGIQTTPVVTVSQDTNTLNVSVPHSGSYDWQDLYYRVDVTGWSGSPGTLLSGTGWVAANQDASGNFSVDITGLNPSSSIGDHFIEVLGAYTENGQPEQAGSVVSATFTKWAGIQDIQVTVNGDDGTPNNVTIVVQGLSPDTPHGWRFSFTGPPEDGNGSPLTDLSSWGEFVPGEVVYTNPNTTHNTMIKRAGTYDVWAQACWDDGTPVVANPLVAGKGYVQYGPFTVAQHAYTGLTELDVHLLGDNRIRLHARGHEDTAYDHWRYSINNMFSGSAPGDSISGEGVSVPDGDTVEVDLTEDQLETGRVIIYAAGVDTNDLLISAASGSQPVLVRVVEVPEAPGTVVTLDTSYDPSSIEVSPHFFQPAVAERISEDAIRVTSADLATALGFTTQATLDQFIPAYEDSLALLESLSVAPPNFGSADFSAMVTDNFLTIDNGILSDTTAASGGGIMKLVDELDTPRAVLSWRISKLAREGSITNERAQELLFGSTFETPHTLETTDANNNPVEAQTTSVTRRFLSVGDTNPTVTHGASDGIAYSTQESIEAMPATTRYNKTEEWLYTNGYYQTHFKRDGTARTWAETQQESRKGFTNVRGLGFYNNANLRDFINDDPMLAGITEASGVYVSSYATSEESGLSSALPDPGYVPGALNVHPYSLILIDATISPKGVVGSNDPLGWSEYLNYFSWMETDANGAVLPTAQQTAALQACFDAEWTTDPNVWGTGQQRSEYLDEVAEIATLLGLTINMYGYTPTP